MHNKNQFPTKSFPWEGLPEPHRTISVRQTSRRGRLKTSRLAGLFYQLGEAIALAIILFGTLAILFFIAAVSGAI